MKTIIRKVNFRYFFRRSLYLLVISFLLAGCEEEASLSARSVVEAGETEREKTELDKWILDTFTRPYGIEVEYRWDKNAVQNGSYIYPPEVANVKSVLNTIKTLWIDLYTAPELGGDKFLLGKNPLKIYMYGGRNVDGNGMELLDNLEATTNEMLRSVHHQFARHLMELFPYDRSKFLSISRNKYIESTKSIAWIFKGETQGRRGFILAGYPNKKGFFTFHSLLSPEKDFAEIISLKLTYGPKDLLQALDRAKTPYNAGSDKDLQKEYDEQALQAYKELVEKQAFVEDYFSKEIKISLNYLQLISMKQVKEFINKK